MKDFWVRSFLFVLCLGSLTFAQMTPMASDAANWDTWLADADAIAAMVTAPTEDTRESELLELIMLAESRDEAALAKIAYWNTASPSYRWVEIMIEHYENGPPSPSVSRALSLLNLAIYDAVVATWKAKSTSDMMTSPSMMDSGLVGLLPSSPSSSFPSEHAAVAAVASEILSYINPDGAEQYKAMAEEAMESRLLAGMNFRSDIEAGKVIGQAVAEEMIAWAKVDGSDAPWEYTHPEGSLFAVENPVYPMTGSWKSWVLTSNDQFRAAPPPAYDSEVVVADLEEIKNAGTSLPVIRQATYWAGFYTGYQIWYDFANKLLFEKRQADNVPYMALVYAALGAAQHDSIVACFDSKYAYSYARPSHIDPEVKPLFPVPPHPSYPSAHSCASSAQANVFAHFFPHASEEAMQMAQDAGQSRIYGGIHYQIDNTAGLELGEKVAGVVIEKLKELTK